jgi:hypothetical protein
MGSCKVSRDRPRWSMNFRYVKAPDFLDIRHCEVRNVVTLPHRPSLPPGVSWYSFLEAKLIPGYMVSSQLRKQSPATPLGIDPETLRLSAHCLNHYATPDPMTILKLGRLLTRALKMCQYNAGVTELPYCYHIEVYYILWFLNAFT